MKNIFLNQVGYLPQEKKVATLLQGGHFSIRDEQGEEVYAGDTTEFGMDDASGDYIYLADFSELQKTGVYQLLDETGECSYSFTISLDVYHELHKDLIKALYYQRCGCALEEKYAGVYKHGKCHTGLSKLWEHPETKLNLCGGWHDAGDYGRYATAGAVAVGHMLYAFLLFPDGFQEDLKIPESGNGVPDVLNECRYELEWLLKLQREDGAVYHKVTAQYHAPFVMPEEDTDQFYAYPVSSMAVGDFAACLALASRIYRAYDSDFANRMFSASKRAYEWLTTHKEFVGFTNPSNSGTGEYGDSADLDERLWAACELFVITGEETYLTDIEELLKKEISLTQFGWAEVSGFASMCILTDPQKRMPEMTRQIFQKRVLEEADRLVEIRNASGYGVAALASHFAWGSNGTIGNRGMLFLLAGRLTGQKCYTEAALDQLHYVLGRNALNYSYVTGYGEHAYKHPHLRPTESDGIDEPMPGWVSGGPNGKPCDEAAIAAISPDTPPMKCFVDDWGSYSTNEITIYWNSPFVFLVSAFL